MLANDIQIQSQTLFQSTAGPEGGTCRGLITVDNQIFTSMLYSGIYASTDRGMTWTIKNRGMEGKSTMEIAHFQGSLLTTVFQIGVYRSTDFGDTWSLSNNGLPNYQIMSLFATNTTVFTGIFFSGVYRSANGGLSWSKASNGMNGTETIYEFGLKGDTLFALGYLKIYRSGNDGNQWQQIGTGLSKSHYQSFIVINDKIIIGASNGIVVSEDNGDNWTEPHNELDELTVQSLWKLNSYVYAGTSAGCYRSDDNAVSWTLIDHDLWNNNIISITSIDTTLLVGTNGNGIFRSENNGDLFFESNTGIAGTLLTDIASLSGTLFTSTWSSGLYRATDPISNWERIPTQANEGELQFTNTLAALGGKLFAGTINGLYASNDNGNNWSQVDLGINDTRVDDILISDANLYLQTSEGFFYSADSGLTWNVSANGLSSTDISGIAISPDYYHAIVGYSEVYRTDQPDGSWVLTTTGLPVYQYYNNIIFFNNALFIGTSYGLYQSTDNGSTWNLAEFLYKDISCLKVVNNYAFLSPEVGVLYYSNDGTTWTQLNDSSINYSITSVEIFDNYLYIATNGAGLWRMSMANLSSIEDNNSITDHYRLYQNYPNPFNHSSKINYFIQKGGLVRITVFDILGKEIGTLVNEEKSPGFHQVEFSGENLPTGIYFYKMEINDYSGKNKLLLVK